jgi:hypothetical protein
LRSHSIDILRLVTSSNLSAVLLVGLVLNSLFNWSWADPIAALVIAAIAVREGVNAWKGDPCCCTPSIGHRATLWLHVIAAAKTTTPLALAMLNDLAVV